MFVSKYRLLPLLAALLLLLSGFFPIFSWQVYGQTGELQAVLVFSIFSLDYFNVAGEILSSQENTALAWLSYGIAAILIGTVFLIKDPAVQQKMLRTAALLVGAQLFSFIVTSIRAGNSLKAPALNPNVGLAMILSMLSFLILLFLFLRQKSLTK